jgi:hypothetical protein
VTHRRYEVFGTDEHGDVHSFHTNDRGAADEIVAAMSEDLEEVQLIERKSVETGMKRTPE